MKVLIAFAPDASLQKVANAIANGAKEINAEVTVEPIGPSKMDLSVYDFVFLGSKLSAKVDPLLESLIQKSPPKITALFFVSAKMDQKAVDVIVSQLAKKNLVVKYTFTATIKGGLLSILGNGAIKEADLIRARGFGERTLNNAFGLSFGSESEKSKIKGYLK